MKVAALLQRVPARVYVAGFWLACLAVGVLSLMPPAVPLPSTGWDKSNHALAFVLLTLLAAASWPHRRARVLIALAAYGGAIEVAQYASGYRSAEWLDWLADLVGITAGSLAWWRAVSCMRGKRGSYSDI